MAAAAPHPCAQHWGATTSTAAAASRLAAAARTPSSSSPASPPPSQPCPHSPPALPPEGSTVADAKTARGVAAGAGEGPPAAEEGKKAEVAAAGEGDDIAWS